MNQSPTPRTRSNLILKTGLIVALAGAGLWLAFSARQNRAAAAAEIADKPAAAAAAAQSSAKSAAVSVPAPAAPVINASGALEKWLLDYRGVAALATNDARRVSMLATGEQLAEQRRVWMRQLIRENPEQAIKESLRFDEYAALPDSIQARVERPFSDRAEYQYLPICEGPNGEQPIAGLDHVGTLSFRDGTEAEAFTYGQRAGVMSKYQMPASGVVLDGVAALRDGVFREVSANERSIVMSKFTAGQRDLSKSFATGKPISGGGVLGLAGDRFYAFADQNELHQFDRRLSALDSKPGPRSGSSVLYYEALPVDPSGAFNFPAAEGYAAAEASAWTETKKKLFLIRVDFSDLPGAQVSQAAANNELNGPSSDFVRAMSYGKTWIEAAVSTNVYRLPQTAAYYSDTNNPNYNSGTFSSKNNDLLRDARNVFRNTRSGNDALIDIGPVDNNTSGTGGGNGLGNYDIVAVFFGNIGMKSGGVYYAGLAGGGDMWSQADNETALYTHEIGHNYGLGHASFWQTSDGSVIGAGSSVEYGDPFDVMGSGPAVLGHYHSQAKALLNWITTNQWVDATAAGSGTYRIYRIDDANTVGNLRGVRITRSAVPGNQDYYWIGFRPVFTSQPHLQQGAYLNWQRPGQSRCWLLDTTPNSSGGKNDSPVDLGTTYFDSTYNLYITPLATGGTGSEQYLDVRVNFGPYPGNHAPTSSGISGPGTVAARTPASYSVGTSDSDNDTLAFSWNTYDGVINLSSSNITHTWLAGGAMPLSVTVSDMKGGTVTVSNTVTVTDPLDTWTTGTVGTTGNLQDLLFAKGRFVGVDWFGGSYLSWDGTNWENTGTLPGYDNMLSSHPQLAFGANTFVAVGRKVSTSSAQICYSPDGRLWKVATFPGGIPQMYDVAYANGQFVAVGAGGSVLRSTNGVTWTSVTAPTALDFNFVTWDGGAWVAVGLNNGGGYAERAWSSLDGITWNQQVLLGMQALEVFGYGGTAYALGYYGGLSYSTDHGVTWQKATLPGTSSWSARHMAAALDGTLLMSGQAMNEGGSPYALLISTDGRTWARSANNTDVAANTHALAFGHGRFLSLESGGVTRRSAPFYPANSTPNVTFTAAPTNGTARIPIYFAASGTDVNGDSITYAWDLGAATTVLDGFEIAPVFSLGGTYNITLRVSDGRGGITNLARSIVVSDPARTWTQRTSPVANNLYAIAGSSSNVVAVGDGGKILSSPDGATWTARSVPEYAGNIYFYTIIWDGSRYIAAGMDYDFALPGWINVIYSSTNGINWSRVYRSAGAVGAINAVASNGSTRVAVGDNGTVLVSLNGTNWSSVTIPGLGTATMSGAAYAGGTFVFVGYVGSNGGVKSYTSTDGTNWVDRSAGVAIASWQDLRKVAWMGDRFVASGWYSKLCVSTDGGQSFASNRSHTEQLPAMAHGDGIWFAAGVDRDAGNANVDVMSLDGVNWLSFPGHVNVGRNGAVFFNHTFISVGDGGNIWQSGVLSPAAGFPAWQLANFPAGGIISLGRSDPDNDGAVNSVEYALGRDPNLATGANGTAQLPNGIFLTNRFWLHIDMPDPAPFDAVYNIWGSTNVLGTWISLATKNGTNAWQWLGGGSARLNVGPVSSGRVPVDVSWPDSANGSKQYLLRLQIQTP